MKTLYYLPFALMMLASKVQCQQTAALIIGGYTSGEDVPRVTDTVELFGL